MTEQEAYQILSICAEECNKCDMCREIIEAIHIACEILEERIKEK